MIQQILLFSISPSGFPFWLAALVSRCAAKRRRTKPHLYRECVESSSNSESWCQRASVGSCHGTEFNVRWAVQKKKKKKTSCWVRASPTNRWRSVRVSETFHDWLSFSAFLPNGAALIHQLPAWGNQPNVPSAARLSPSLPFIIYRLIHLIWSRRAVRGTSLTLWWRLPDVLRSWR